MEADGKYNIDYLKLHAAVESSGEAIFITDTEGIITYINPSFTDMYGFEADEVIGKVTPRILKSGVLSVEYYQKFWSSLLKKEVVRIEFINKTRDGRLITVEGSANPILDDRDEIVGFIGIQHDISSRKVAEEALKKSEEKFRQAFMTSSDSVNINRLSDGVYVSVNEGFTRILGYSEEDVLGKTSVEMNIWADVENRKVLSAQLMEKGRVDNFEAFFRHKDGSLVIGLMSANLIDIDGTPHILSITKDITSRKRIEKDLAFERSLIDALMNNLDDYIYIKDKEGRFIRINKSQAQLLGLEDPDLVIGKTDRDFYTRDHTANGYEDEQYVIGTGQSLSKEERLTLKGLPDKWVLTTKIPLIDAEGMITGSFGISKDITDRKYLEDALRLEQIRLQAIIDNSPDQIFYKDRNSKFILCNKPVAMLAGCDSVDDLIGKSDFDFHPQHLARQYFDEEQELMEKNVPVLNHEEPIIDNRTGLQHWNLSSKVPVTDDDGKVIGLFGFNRDITSRKRTELENRVIYEIINGITITTNLDELLELIHQSLGKVVYADNCFVALHDDKTGLFSFPMFIDKIDTKPLPTNLEKSCTQYVFRTKQPLLLNQQIFDQLVEMNEVKLVGTNSPSWIGIPLQSSLKVIGVLVLQHYEKDNVYSEKDVQFLTSVGSQIAIAIERKIAEEEIILKNEMLLTINAEKDKFFSIIAHDLRGPLSAFVSATQILTEEIQNMTIDEIRDLTSLMKTDASNVYKLLENLLEWSRLQRGIMEFKPVDFDLAAVISGTIANVSSAAKAKGIEIDLIMPDKVVLSADEHMIETVLRNLLTNAIKFTPASGKISVMTLVYPDKIEVKVTDSGIGIPEEILNKLFLLHEKVSRKGTEGEPSSGLGLLLCKEFVEKHGGTISVESQEGKGSTFSFTIPVSS